MALLCYASAHWGLALFCELCFGPKRSADVVPVDLFLPVVHSKFNSQEKVELWPISTH